MEKTAGKLGLIIKYFTDLSLLQLQQLAALDDLYKEWNNKINVISRKDIDSLYERHILHSLSIAAVFKFKKGNEIIDIGTGGGFPAIALAIFFPDAHFHAVDSIGKKIKVVAAIAGSIGLSNFSAQHTRAEDIKKRQFDAAVSRAVASLKELWAWSKPLLRERNKRDGINDDQESARGLICLKGGDLAREISECGCRPSIKEIYQIFPEEYFREKFIVHVTDKGERQRV